MKKHWKQVISLLLVLILILNLLQNSALAVTENASDVNTSAGTSNMEISGTDSVGTMLASAISAEAATDSEAECYIAD